MVVVTYNSAEYVGALLSSLPAAMEGVETYSLVVVDNGSSDATLSILEGRRDLLLDRSTNKGFAAGVNRGVLLSPRAEAILVLNPDATMDPGGAAAMLEVLRRRRAGVVAPRVRELDGRLSPSLRREPTVLRVGGLSFTGLPVFAERMDNPRDYAVEREVDWAMGAVMLIDSRCFEAVGGLDESYFLYSEETQFCLDARDQGWPTVYTPAAGAMHVGGGSGESILTHTMQMVNRVRLHRRRRGTLPAFGYLVGSVLVEARRAVTGSRMHWGVVRALLHPPSRPEQISAGDRLLPR